MDQLMSPGTVTQKQKLAGEHCFIGDLYAVVG